MKYIVLDLEWNQCPAGKEKSNKRLPFEIIEIGAVKLDEQFNILDVFSATIRPKVYKYLHYKIREISKITMKELNKSKCFKEVCDHFLDWCGVDYVFCTWGTLDLTELQRNMQFYKISRRLEFPLKYFDIQKLYSIDKEEEHIRRSLKDAIEELELAENLPFHRALYDSIYTVKIMREIDFSKVSSYYSIDSYFVPRNKSEEIYARFLTYNKYISRRFGNKEIALMDKEVISIKCSKCGEYSEVKIPWFSDNSKVYYALGYCKEHGYMKCKIRLKKNVNSKTYVIKIIKPINKEGARIIVDKQNSLRIKRRERRLHQKGEGK